VHGAYLNLVIARMRFWTPAAVWKLKPRSSKLKDCQRGEGEEERTRRDSRRGLSNDHKKKVRAEGRVCCVWFEKARALQLNKRGKSFVQGKKELDAGAIEVELLHGTGVAVQNKTARYS